jgi:ribosomal protein S18 acetylase RimI-like enzyme
MFVDTDRLIIRQVSQEDLCALEWDGQFTHFRRIYANAYHNQQKGNAVLWVAELDGLLLGQTFVQLIGPRPELADGELKAYIYSVRVKNKFRNIGIGAKLMFHTEDDIAKRGYSFATLNVGKNNLAAKRFYERLGYQVVGDEPGKWSYLDHLGNRNYVHEPSWRMQKSLVGIS